MLEYKIDDKLRICVCSREVIKSITAVFESKDLEISVVIEAGIALL